MTKAVIAQIRHGVRIVGPKPAHAVSDRRVAVTVSISWIIAARMRIVAIVIVWPLRRDNSAKNQSPEEGRCCPAPVTNLDDWIRTVELRRKVAACRPNGQRRCRDTRRKRNNRRRKGLKQARSNRLHHEKFERCFDALLCDGRRVFVL